MLEDKNISQAEFARMSKMIRSKVSRLLANRIYCDQPTLVLVLNAFSSKEDKLQLLNAYLNDVAGPEALALLVSKEDPVKELKLAGLSRKAQDKLVKILRSAHVDDFENVLLAMAQSWGL